MKPVFKLLKLNELRPHEETIPDYVKKLKAEILNDGVLIKPIIVDVKTKVILDGHHRHKIMQELGKDVIPVWLIDYKSDDVHVTAWESGKNITKQDVLNAGLTGKLLKPKTSRHMLRIKRVKKVPLENLL